MHKVYFFIVITILITGYHAAAQAPGIKWQKALGGTSIDNAGDADTNTAKRPKISLIDKNGYLIGGNTNSNDGDINGNNGNTDVWVARLDTQRNITWSTCLGGSDYEELGSVQRVPDSGYIVAASTWSNNGKVSGNHGSGDAWIVRLGSTGNVVWQKCYGGSNVEEGTYIEKIADGYIMTGSTASTDGDVTGLHGTNNFDLWVVKLDNSGAVVWQKCLGGTGAESGIKVKQTADGGYIVLGRTGSTNGDVTGMHGTSDIWVVKLDSNGAIEWQKCLGGSNDDLPGDILITSTGYIITGHTWSRNGDVSGIHSMGDAWVVSISATGSILWQRCYGGNDQDALSSIILLPDNTYVAAGFTGSASGNGDVSYNHGTYDYWLVNFSASGTLIWEKTYGGSGWEGASVVGLNPAGNLVVLGSTWSNDLDVTGNHGQNDIWLFEAGTTNSITGQVFYDVNKNGIKDNGEVAFDQVTVRAQKGGELRSSIPANGNYKIDIDTGSYVVNAVPYYNYYTILPTQQNVNHTNWFNTDVINFAVQPNASLRDVTVGLWGNAARPGFTVMYTLYYKNVGVEPVLTGKVKMVKDHRITFMPATPAPASVNGDTVTWNFNNLNPNTSVFMYFNMQIGTMPSVNLGDTLKSVVWIEPDGIDITPKDDTMVLKQIVTGSFDPNDKTEANAGVITPEQVANGEYLNYLIRFQNTGTDTAFNITVRDTLENRLDWNTLQMIAASHPYQLSIEDGNKLAWQFNNILLPYTSIDEPNSHGYIAYRIKPKPTVLAGDTIKNTAGIYFDYNLPIATNTEKTVVFLLSPLPVTLTSFQAAEEGDAVNVTWATSMEEHLKYFEVQRSTNGIDFMTIGKVNAGQKAYLFKDKQPLKGYNYYRLRSVDADGAFTLSTIVLVNLKNGADIISSLYPNPATGNATLKLQGTVEGNVLVQVLDQQGRLVTTKQFGVQHTAAFKTPLDLGRLAKGSYVLRIIVNDKTYMHKLLIQ